VAVVATGDQPTIKKFLAANPSFSKGFRIKQPQIYVKQDGKWVEFTPQSRHDVRLKIQRPLA
jgi:hypothetical protein